MKRSFIFSIFLFVVIVIQAQVKVQPPVSLRNVERKASRNLTLDNQNSNGNLQPLSFPSVSDPEDEIGTTVYDLQTNDSSPFGRLIGFEDGTYSAVWTIGNSPTSYNDRGTGYNYFNGNSWAANPTGRIESVKTGWPAIARVGANGEAVIAHQSGTLGLRFSKRLNKGSGSWTESTIPPPSGTTGLLWPRMVSGGTNHNTLHVIALTAPTANGGTSYNGQNGALVYIRSLDGGTTWSTPIVLPGLGSSSYVDFDGDTYDWAEPQGNTIAFAVADNANDLVLMKSVNNGDTWTKTIVWQNPYPLLNPNTTATDTMYAPDKTVALAFDNTGKLHLTFGVYRLFFNGDGSYSYYPGLSGIAYWNENLSTFTGGDQWNILDPDLLDQQGRLIGTYSIDWDGNGALDYVDPFDYGDYGVAWASMSQLAFDANNNGVFIFSSIIENYDNGSQQYRHIWCRTSNNNFSTWSDIFDLSDDPVHYFDECVFPSICANSDATSWYFTYQYDNEPGLSIRGDLDPPGNNYINFYHLLKATSPNTITATPNPLNAGYITGAGSYTTGTQVTLLATPYSCWQFSNWTENGTVVATTPSYTFLVSGSRNLGANFIQTSYVPDIDVNPGTVTINYPGKSFLNPPSYSLLVNSPDTILSDQDVAVEHPLGSLIPDSIVQYWETHPAPVYIGDNSLTAIDWSVNDSPVKNQGSCGSCWAFAATAYIENLGTRTDLSEQVIVSCSGAGDCDGGYFYDALLYYQSDGAPEESCYPYTATNGYCGYACSNPAYMEKITTVSNQLWGLATVDNIKAQLQSGPLVVRMLVPTDNTFNGSPGYTGGVYNYSGGTIPQTQGHAVLLVGYDDAQQCFKVKNSWGSGWGESGYFRIAYDDVTDDVQFGSYAVNGSGVYTQYSSSNVSTISNLGCVNLSILSITDNKDWLTTSGYPATPFTIASGSSQTINISVDWALVGSVQQTGTITISSNDPDEPTSYIYVIANPNSSCSVIVSSNPSYGGIVSGGGSYTTGQTATVTATPNTGWTFTNWTENGNIVSNSWSYSFIVSVNRTLVANFTQDLTYVISTASNPPAGGTTTGSGTYAAGTQATVTATPEYGYDFLNWTENGNAVSLSPSYTFTVAANRALVANFNQQAAQYSVTATANPSNGGITTGGGMYTAGSMATVTATPNSGWVFVNWTEYGSQVSTNASYSFQVNSNRSLVANFTQGITYTISTSSNPAIGGSTSGGGTYAAGTAVTLIATAANGYYFIDWTEGGTTVSTNSSYSFTVSSNRVLVANFSPYGTQYSITATPSPINGGYTVGGGSYNAGTIATVVATANLGWTFFNWTEFGSQVSNSPTYSFTANANRDLVANFIQQFSIIASPNPTYAGYTIGGGYYSAGQTVVLQATPNNGWKFYRWTENGSTISTSSTYSFVANVNRILIADFLSTVGTDEHDKDGIAVYPNPANNRLNIAIGRGSETRIHGLKLYNSIGECLYDGPGSNEAGNIYLDVQQYPAGLYLLKIELKDGREKGLRIVIQH